MDSFCISSDRASQSSLHFFCSSLVLLISLNVLQIYPTPSCNYCIDTSVRDWFYLSVLMLFLLYSLYCKNETIQAIVTYFECVHTHTLTHTHTHTPQLSYTATVLKPFYIQSFANSLPIQNQNVCMYVPKSCDICLNIMSRLQVQNNVSLPVYVRWAQTNTDSEEVGGCSVREKKVQQSSLAM